MIKSSLKDINKSLKTHYKSPFKVSNYKEELEGEIVDFIVIEDINKRTLARFQYLKEDGAIISGYNDSPLYKSEREQYFPAYYDQQHLDIYQKVFDLFYDNPIVKEYVQKYSLGTVNKNMFDISDDHRRGVALIKCFYFLGNSSRSDSSIGLQYYINEHGKITPRMKIEFSFRTCGSITLYYDYSSNSFHFGKASFNESNKLVKLDDEKTTELFNIKSGEVFIDDEHLNLIFTRWMLEMGCRLNKQAFVAYKMNELIEVADTTKVLEHLSLIKMALI